MIGKQENVGKVLARSLVLEELTLNIDVDTEQMVRLLAALANCRSLRSEQHFII
jgi:hypothetical protein